MEPAKTWMHFNVVLQARLVEAERTAYITGDLGLASAHARALDFMFDRRDLEIQFGDVIDHVKHERDVAEAELLTARAKAEDLLDQLQSLEINHD